jgi:predicted RNase H-like nuclease
MTNNKTKIEQCSFQFQCPKTWGKLLETNIALVRFCDSCERNVYLSSSTDVAYKNAELGRCVAIPIELTLASKERLQPTHVVGMMEPPEYRMEGPPPKRAKNFHDRNFGGNASKPIFFGLDGCKAGWFFIGIDDQGEFQFSVLEKFEEVHQYLEQAKLILVDIPIGLPWQGQKIRLCDTAARQAISPRGSSVFPAPARSALFMASYPEGSAENRRQLGKGLSKQSWNISPKIKEVDEYMRSVIPGKKVREMHPEVAFWALNGKKVLSHKKKDKAGIDERLGILSRHYDRAEECFLWARQQYLVKEVATDDILDAMVGAVTAMQYPRLSTLPATPVSDEEGIPMEIVYCGDF